MARTVLKGNGMVVLGDRPGQQTAVEGTLIAVRQSPKYPDNLLFDVETDAGETVTVAGNAALNTRLSDKHVGKYVWLTFKGMATTAAGTSFKNVEVAVDLPDGDDEPGS